MALTLPDLMEKLKSVDEISLLEVLNISSEEIVERFMDYIEANQETLSRDFDEDTDDDAPEED